MKKNIFLLIIVIILAIIPLYSAKNAEFGGADGKAEEIISQLNPDYKPWFTPIFEPPSGEIESLLFALQACLGTGIIAYYIGFLKGKNSASKY